MHLVESADCSDSLIGTSEASLHDYLEKAKQWKI
jgi:hypothetical protein